MMKHFRGARVVVFMLSLLCVSVAGILGGSAQGAIASQHTAKSWSVADILGGSAQGAIASRHTAKFWLQTMDSCRHAIPGADFVLKGNGLSIPAGPGPGSSPQVVGSGGCPVQRGNCSTVSTGCLSWNVPIPSSGSKTYKITETVAPHNYVWCTGGSVCPGGPVVVTLKITSRGLFSATVRNVYPDGTVVVWPTSGSPYTGKLTNPAVVHNFGLGNGSCDGDQDADDQLTGTPSGHCDSDRDRHH